MINKGHILLFIFVLLLPTLATAQQAAQATMRVSVRVVSAASATTVAQNNLQFGKDGVKGDLGSIAISGVDLDQVLITNDASLALTNKQGHKLELPVDASKDVRDQRKEITLSGSDKRLGRNYEGTYSGTLHTTIEYL